MAVKLDQPESKDEIMSDSPLSPLVKEYFHRIHVGNFRHDKHQIAILQRIDDLATKLDGYIAKPTPTLSYPSGLFGKMFGSLIGSSSGKKGDPSRTSTLDNEGIKGMYLYGDVGTGKTMLMDLLFAHAKVEKKRRVHFNAFMLNFHSRYFDVKHDLSDNDASLNSYF